jgi:predicted GNAT family acetyltransferase
MGSLIESGKLRRNGRLSGRGELERIDYPYEMKNLCEDSLRDLVGLQSLIAERLPEPEIFRLHDELDFNDIFQGEHSVIGVTTAIGLVAYSIIRIPGLAEDNLGRDLFLTKKEQMKVAHLQATVVHPHFRGNGLQKKMARAHLEVIAEMGYEHVCCTISPKNPVSLSNILSCSFVIRGLIPKFGGWWRYIMYKGTPGPSYTSVGIDTTAGNDTVIDKGSYTGSSSLTEEEVRIRCSDIVGQVDLLKKGFVGVRLAIGPKNPEVIYRKF